MCGIVIFLRNRDRKSVTFGEKAGTYFSANEYKSLGRSSQMNIRPFKLGLRRIYGAAQSLPSQLQSSVYAFRGEIAPASDSEIFEPPLCLFIKKGKSVERVKSKERNPLESVSLHSLSIQRLILPKWGIWKVISFPPHRRKEKDTPHLFFSLLHCRRIRTVPLWSCNRCASPLILKRISLTGQIALQRGKGKNNAGDNQCR